jgi:hypothetical protein
MTPLNQLKCILSAVIALSILSTVWLNQQQTTTFGAGNFKEGDERPQLVSPLLSKSTSKPRILLGIFSVLDIPTERQRRHLIRNTYLDFDRLHRPNQPNRVCSLQQFRNEPREHCLLIYTFVLGAPKNRTSVPAYDDSNSHHTTIDPSLIDNHEQDVIYLNVPEESNRVGKIWKWFHYGASLGDEMMLDYIAYTDSQVSILPTIFWENALLKDPAQPHIYAGIPIPKSECTDSKCPSLQGDYVMRRFVLISTDLVQYLSSSSLDTNLIPSLEPKESPDVAIANALQSQNITIQNVTLQGLVSKTSYKGLVGDFLYVWDRYKDNLVTYEDPSEVALVQASPAKLKLGGDNQNPRILLGIFTMDSPLEKERRDVIRKTYLKAFAKSSKQPHRICSLQQLLDEVHALPNEHDCQLAYTFVMGGNPNGPTELVDFNASYPMTVPTRNQLLLRDEADIVHLNIRENMKEGKSQTWLKYATTVLETRYLDYIGKTDTDTLIYPRLFLDQILQRLPRFPNNIRIYGGDYRIKPSMSTLNLGPVYMGGHLYFMSPDLARYSASTQCNRSVLAVYSEDQSIGNFVHSHPLPIHRIRMNTNVFEHPVKRIDRVRTLWRKHAGVSKQQKKQQP